MHLPATGDIERAASDKLGFVRGQKDDSPSDIHWLGDSSQGRWIDKKFLQEVFGGHPFDFGGLGHTLPNEIRVHRPGADGIDRDVVFTEFEGDRLGKTDHAELCRTIGARQGFTGFAGHVGNVHNPAVPTLDHGRHCGLRAEENAPATWGICSRLKFTAQRGRQIF